jgi:hypothetical protein
MEITITSGSWKHKQELYLANKYSNYQGLKKYIYVVTFSKTLLKKLKNLIILGSYLTQAIRIKPHGTLMKYKYLISKGNLFVTNKQLQMPSLFLSLADTVTKNNTHNKIGNNKDITSTLTYFLSQISKHSFPVVGLKPVSTIKIINTII